MNTARILYQMALADFRERTRRFRFLATLAAVVYLGLQVANGSLRMRILSDTRGITDPNLINRLPEYLGELNSAWIGSMMSLVVSVFLSLFGFYLVKDCIERDTRTGVGQIIATTPIRRATYLVGKWLSNVALLSVMVLILAVAGLVIQTLQAGIGSLNLPALIMPFLVVALPMMALTAALAVLFETVGFLRGALGNVVYFFLWIVLLITSIEAIQGPGDPFGLRLYQQSLLAAAQNAYPQDAIGGISLSITEPRANKLFPWPGIEWSAGLIARQWAWFAGGLGLVLVSALWFARFDPSRAFFPRKPAAQLQEAPPSTIQQASVRNRLRLPNLSPLVSRLAQTSPFLGVLFAELRLLLNGQPWWWWAVLAGMNIGALTNPEALARQGFLAAAWLWPLAIWSGMGNRERRFQTHTLVFSTSRPVLRQLPAAWLAGVLATILFGIGGGIAALRSGDLFALAAWLAGAIFIPTLALALGVISDGERLFQVLYLWLWYIGPVSKSTGLDFTTERPQIYLLVSLGLFAVAAFWRSRQVRSG